MSIPDINSIETFPPLGAEQERVRQPKFFKRHRKSDQRTNRAAQSVAPSKSESSPQAVKREVTAVALQQKPTDSEETNLRNVSVIHQLIRTLDNTIDSFQKDSTMSATASGLKENLEPILSFLKIEMLELAGLEVTQQKISEMQKKTTELQTKINSWKSDFRAAPTVKTEREKMEFKESHQTLVAEYKTLCEEAATLWVPATMTAKALNKQIKKADCSKPCESCQETIAIKTNMSPDYLKRLQDDFDERNKLLIKERDTLEKNFKGVGGVHGVISSLWGLHFALARNDEAAKTDGIPYATTFGIRYNMSSTSCIPFPLDQICNDKNYSVSEKNQMRIFEEETRA